MALKGTTTRRLLVSKLEPLSNPLHFHRNMSTMPKDDLAEINGVKPKKYLADGDECEAKSHTRLWSFSEVTVVSESLTCLSTSAIPFIK